MENFFVIPLLAGDTRSVSDLDHCFKEPFFTSGWIKYEQIWKNKKGSTFHEGDKTISS